MANSNIIIIKSELLEAEKTLHNFISLEENLEKINRAVEIMVQSIKSGGKIISCGNGGSSCDAMHFAEEMTGRYRENRKSLPAIAISDPSHLTCVSNDYGYPFVFSRFLESLGNPNDVLLGISTSGNSENVINAINTAKSKGMKTIALTGKNGGKIAGTVDEEIRVAHHGYADRIQEVHIKIIHIFILLIEKHLT